MEDQDLDDLFADPLNEPLNEEQLQQQLDGVTPVPPPPGLAERVDQLRLNGCCDRIAWSRIGSIAYLSRDRRDVYFSNLRFRNDKGDWVRNDYTDYTFPQYLRGLFKGRELAHLSWNHTSLELLVADVCGRIALFSLYVAINRAASTKIISPEQDDSLNTLVGQTWLNQKRPLRLSKGAQKQGDTWKYHFPSDTTRGILCPPSVPQGNIRSAFIAVTRKGTIIFGYQPLDQGAWTDLKHDLDGLASSADLLTHAAFCPDTNDNTLLVVHTVSKKLRVYSLTVDWHTSKQPLPQPVPAPTFASQHLTSIDACRPATDTHWSVPTPELSRLEVIPRSCLEKPDLTYPTIVASFTGSEGLNEGEPTYTVVSRWEIKDTIPTVDVSFTQLSTKRTASSELKAEKRLHRLLDVRMDRVILQIIFQQHNDNIIFTSSDGAVEFRDRKMEMLRLDEAPDHVNGIVQLGFSLSNQKACLHTAISPNSMVKAYMGRDHELEIAVMQLPIEMVDLEGVATLEKIATAFVVTNTIAESQLGGNSTNDDLIMALYRFVAQLPPDQQDLVRTIFLKETYRNMQMADKLIDMSQVERHARTGPMIRCFSLQAAIGNYGDRLSRNLPSKIAITALNLRHIFLAYVLAMMPNPRAAAAAAQAAAANGGSAASQAAAQAPQESEFNRPDVLQYLTQLTAWYLMLIDHVMSTLFALNRALNVSQAGLDADTLRAEIAQRNECALHLLCGTFTRALFRHATRLLRVLAACAAKPAMAQPPSSTAAHWDAFARTLQQAAVAPQIFDTLLAELDDRISRAYTDVGVSESPVSRIDAELELVAHGILSPALLGPAGPVAWLLGPAIDRLRVVPAPGSTANAAAAPPTLPADTEAKLAFQDASPLALGDDARARAWRRATLWDGVQKKVLARRGPALAARFRRDPVALLRELRVRTCTRCGISMEDVPPPRPKDPRYPAVFQNFRLCLCNAHFVTERLEDLCAVVDDE